MIHNARTDNISSYDVKLKVPVPSDLRNNSNNFWNIKMDASFIPIE